MIETTAGETLSTAAITAASCPNATASVPASVSATARNTSGTKARDKSISAVIFAADQNPAKEPNKELTKTAKIITIIKILESDFIFLNNPKIKTYLQN